MKKMKFLIQTALLVVVVCFYSCKENNTEKITEAPDKDPVSAEKLAQIKALGFSTNGVKKTASGYIVEGDLLLTDRKSVV